MKKYIGILNFINHIVCMIICIVVIVLAIENDNELYFCGCIIALPLLMWNLKVFAEKMANAFDK